MEAHLVEWLNLCVRWIHMITGIAWIGASFYFNWLENSLDRKNPRAGLAGNLWAIHGGGFYYLEKYKVAPEEIPETLHWFKWEAYLTWISGVCLMAIVYYWNADLYMVDASKWDISGLTAVGVGLGTMLGSWIVYDLMCKSPLGKHNGLLGLIGFSMVVAIAYGLCEVFNPRAAYIHVGALLGTCMAANVFFVIIPSQRLMVDAAKEGKAPDGRFGLKALQRSRHNNYMTLPVLFIMISNHFPSTFGNQYNWLVLAGLSLSGAMIRHWFNLKGMGQKNTWILPIAALGMLSVFYMTAPPSAHSGQQVSGEPVDFKRVEKIVQERCLSCHSSNPTDDVFRVAPNGVVFEKPEQIKHWAEQIKARTVSTETMPFANKTKMTKEERRTLGLWINQGAKLN